MNLDSLEEVCLDLNTIRNDFIFLHVNSFGESFLTAHELFEEFYKQLQDDIDVVLEIYAGLSDGVIAVPFSLNKSKGSYIRTQDISASKDLFELAEMLCSKIVDNLEKARDSVDNNGYISEIDGLLEYWEKQTRFIVRRFCV